MPRRAFTLIELLVVIGILALLMGLLLPALGRARASGRSAACLSNLRQMNTALLAYANENALRLVVSQWSEVRPGGVWVNACWDLTAITEGGQTRVEPGILWGPGGAMEIQQCPEFDGKGNWLVDTFTGYNYNTSYLGGGQGEADPNPARLFWAKNPSNTATFGDGEFSGGANRFMRAPRHGGRDGNFPARWTGTQGFRHLGRTNIAFLDGSARSHIDRHARTEPNPTIDDPRISPHCGFLSEDNSMYDLE